MDKKMKTYLRKHLAAGLKELLTIKACWWSCWWGFKSFYSGRESELYIIFFLASNFAFGRNLRCQIWTAGVAAKTLTKEWFETWLCVILVRLCSLTSLSLALRLEGKIQHKKYASPWHIDAVSYKSLTAVLDVILQVSCKRLIIWSVQMPLSINYDDLRV